MLNSLSPFTLNTQVIASDLNTALSTHKFQPCTTATPSTHGFIYPFAHSEDLAYELNKCIVFAFKIESKVIPASALKKEVAATGLVTASLSDSYQALLPTMTKLTANAATESAAIVAQLQAGKLTVDAAKAIASGMSEDEQTMTHPLLNWYISIRKKLPRNQ